MSARVHCRDALHSHALLYIGHGSGSKYYSHESMLSDPAISAQAFLMGCSSVRMGLAGCCVRLESPLYYLLLGCPIMVGCLWDVSDGDLDRMTRYILEALMVFALILR